MDELLGNTEWSPMTNLADIIQNIPDLVSKSLKETLFGTFHLGKSYNINLWNLSSDYSVTICKELYPKKNIGSPLRLLVITDNTLLVLEPRDGNFSDSILMAWGFLSSLIKLKISKDDLIELYWISKGDYNNLWKQIFQLREPEKFAEEIANKMKNLAVIVKESYKGRFTEEEVTSKSIKELNIKEINENIVLCESSLKTDLTVTKIQTLLLLYQKVIFFLCRQLNTIL